MDEHWSQRAFIQANRLLSTPGGIVMLEEDVFEVKGRLGTYRTHLISAELASCSCPNGQAIGDAKCYHVLAARLVKAGDTPAPPERP